MVGRIPLALMLLLIAGLLTACGGAASPTTTPRPAILPTATPASQATPETDNTADSIRFELTAEGNEARYRVREQLVSLSLPSDAIGVTSAVTGTLVVNQDGTIVSNESKFVVDLTGLRSDQSRRDRYVQSNILQTSIHPTVEFVPTQAIGLPSPLPTSGEVIFQLVGDLTVVGVTRPTTWDITATVTEGRELIGTANTHFTFGEFSLNEPRVPSVLSVEDNIQLELDFHFVRVD